MVNKTISIPQEINDRLKLETNASALISKLLMDYYSYNTEDPKDAIKKIEEKKLTMIEELEKEKEKFIEIKDRQVEMEISETEIEDKKKSKRNQLVSNCIVNTRDIFGIDLTIAQAEEMLDGDYPTVAEYLDIKGLKSLEVEVEDAKC